MTESDIDRLILDLQELVDRAQTRDEHIRAERALATASRIRQRQAGEGAVSGSAARRTSDQRP